HELTVCPPYKLACGFFSSGVQNAAAFRLTLRHLRLRVAPERIRGAAAPWHGPGCSVANLAAPFVLLLLSIIQPKCRHSAHHNGQCWSERPLPQILRYFFLTRRPGLPRKGG